MPSTNISYLNSLLFSVPTAHTADEVGSGRLQVSFHHHHRHFDERRKKFSFTECWLESFTYLNSFNV